MNPVLEVEQRGGDDEESKGMCIEFRSLVYVRMYIARY